MRHKIAQKTRAVAGIFAPAMEMFGGEGVTRLDRAEPGFPIDILCRGLFFNFVIPFTADGVAAVVTLTPDQGADFAAIDQFRAFVPAGSGASLRADLIDATGALHGLL